MTRSRLADQSEDDAPSVYDTLDEKSTMAFSPSMTMDLPEFSLYRANVSSPVFMTWNNSSYENDASIDDALELPLRTRMYA